VRSVFLCIFNTSVTNFVYLSFVGWLYNWQLPWSYHPNGIPDSMTCLKVVLFLLFTEDMCFYTSHRISHCKSKYFPVYQWIHKWHHEYSTPIGIASQYAHPLEHALVNANSFMVGMYILGPSAHYSIIMAWAFVRGLETHDGHSGYEFPWSPFRMIPFGGDATYHNYHHSKNVGNYGSFMSVWDSVLTLIRTIMHG